MMWVMRRQSTTSHQLFNKLFCVSCYNMNNSHPHKTLIAPASSFKTNRPLTIVHHDHRSYSKRRVGHQQTPSHKVKIIDDIFLSSDLTSSTASDTTLIDLALEAKATPKLSAKRKKVKETITETKVVSDAINQLITEARLRPGVTHPHEMYDITPISIDKDATIILDDAIALTPNNEVIVFIADPSAWIDKLNPLWSCARERMQSMYLEESATSWMLPLKALQFLSLSDSQPNLCLAVNVTRGEIFRAKIPPVHRTTFGTVDAILRSRNKEDGVYNSLQELYRMYSATGAATSPEFRSQAMSMLRYFMNRTNSIASRFIVSHGLKRYVVWNESEQSVKISSPLRRFSDWITQEVITDFLSQKAAMKRSFESGVASELDVSSWFKSPYGPQEIYGIQSEFTAFLDYKEEMEESRDEKQKLQMLERRRENIILARIVEVEPHLSHLELEVSPGQLYSAKVHLVSAEEARYLMTLESMSQFNQSTTNSESSADLDRKPGDLVVGAFVYLEIKRLIPIAGVLILEHKWKSKVLRSSFT